jgi:outer membrane protein OmpA-like peptidoglycan-associated protein
MQLVTKFSKFSSNISLLAVVFGSMSAGVCMADVDPAYQEPQISEDAAASAGPLSQYGQPETLPTAAPGSPASKICLPPDASFTVSQRKTGGMGDFPRVQTPSDEEMAHKFSWWPSDAKPAPYKDPDRSGYWWWPEQPGAQQRLWGNQGYIYVRKLIFDYKNEVVQTPQGPMKPSLVIKRIIKNVKVLFDYDKADLRDDAVDILQKALFTLRNNPEADILITGNADIRGSEQYNIKLGERRAASVQEYLIQNGLDASRIRIVSRGKLDALAPTHDLVGMQKDRNAQFIIAEVEEVMIPADKADLFENQQLEEKQELTGEVRVSTKEYTIKSGDTLWGIAQREYGDGKQWKRIYEFNKDIIPNPNKPRKGTRILIPVE